MTPITPMPASFPAIEYPEFTARAVRYQLCWGPAARFLLAKFGYASWGDGRMIPLMVWAAAGAGHVDDAGVWKSARIADPMDLAETLTTEEEIVMGDAVVTMLKNMMPAAIETKPKATGELTPAAE